MLLHNFKKVSINQSIKLRRIAEVDFAQFPFQKANQIQVSSKFAGRLLGI